MDDARRILLSKYQVAEALEYLCQSLELTEAQFLLAKQRYERVGSWLDRADDPVLRALEIYLQGSTAIGTTVRPIDRTEHDVDLIAHCPDVSPAISPFVLKGTIGARLRSNQGYARILEEKARCWRLSYANEFHMDITPSIPNPGCLNGGELVPDKELKEWSPSNPRGYRDLFERRAVLLPSASLRLSVPKGLRAEVEAYPRLGGKRGILRRVVQIAKRHRDQYFSERDPKYAPISVIITTLASRSYERCVRAKIYDNEFDFLCDVVSGMPAFIETQTMGDKRQCWFIWNETTQGENFAEKWNSDPRLAGAFWQWHRRATEDLVRLLSGQGLDGLSKTLARAFGASPAKHALTEATQRMTSARSKSLLGVAPAVGLTVSSAPAATVVPRNTFYGRD